MPSQPILVTVVGGYLGAGKTTLVNHVLRSADERIAVIVNDFGDVAIDADLIESADGDTITLSNGCICCSIVDGFTAALDAIRAVSPAPQRLVIEASGVGMPGQIAAYAHGPGLELDGVVTVVDGETIQRRWDDEYVGDVIAQQVRTADLVVLNKADLADDVEEVRDWLAERTTGPIITAALGRVPLDALLGIDSPDRPSEPPTTAPSCRTWTESSDEPLDRDELEGRLAEVPKTVVRAKGIVRFTDAPDRAAIVQLVGRRLAVTDGGPWDRERSELVFIATTTSTAPEASDSSA